MEICPESLKEWFDKNAKDISEEDVKNYQRYMFQHFITINMLEMHCDMISCIDEITSAVTDHWCSNDFSLNLSLLNDYKYHGCV